MTALNNAIAIKNDHNQLVGKLVPVGKWILQDTAKIELIQQWRQKHMKMFLAQFENSFEKTYDYLKNLSIDQDNRIFFLIYDSNDQFIGHMGLSNIDDDNAELDNFIRGIGGGEPRLVYFAELAMVHWAFFCLKVKKCNLRLLSYNWLVIEIHKEIGFVVTNKLPLKKTVSGLNINHFPVDSTDSNVNYTCDIMELSVAEFKFKV